MAELLNRPRTVEAIMEAPTHTGVKPCFVMNECAIHTIELPEGHFAAIVHSNPSARQGVVAILDEADVEAHITLLRNAIADAKLLDAGKAPIHAAQSTVRN